MNIMYWVKEYILVLLAYGVTMFVWPEIVFRKFLNGRTLTMRICFDSLFMVFASNLLVLLMGLCHILNPWPVRIIFWGGLILSIVVPFVKENGVHTFKRILAFLTGGYGVKSLGSNMAKNTGKVVKESKSRVDRRMVDHYVLYILLVIAIIYGVIYYSAGVFESPSYGFSDIYVHHQWIAQLQDGKVFGSGIYPEGMHTFVYLLNACFGISVYSILLFMQTINITLFFLAIFLLGKELFNWRYSGLMALLLFLVMGQDTADTLFAFSRLQCSLPQEFAAAATLLCPVFLIRFLKSTKISGKETKFRDFYKDENLILFGLALFVTISAHFYCTIIAFFICLAVVPVYFKEVFYWKNLSKLASVVAISVALAVAPMLIALATGNVFQNSIGWAMKVINGDKYNDGTNITHTPTPTPLPGVSEPGQADSLLEKLQQIPELFVKQNYGTNFSSQTTFFFLTAAGVAIACVLIAGMITLIVGSVRKKKGKEKGESIAIWPYFGIILMLLNIMLMVMPGIIGLPQLVEYKRLGYYATIFNILVLLIPLDIIFGALNLYLKDKGDGFIAMAVAAGSIVIVVVSGYFHGSLFFELTRYTSAVNTTVKIMQENEREHYTIVSPVDETWQVAGHGYHEELVHFINEAMSKSYKLSTEKVYIFIEKHPLHYVQKHFPQVPMWLADGKRSQDICEFTKLVTTGPNETIHYDQDEEIGEYYHLTLPVNSYSYKNPNTRIIVESRAMNIMRDFDILYPRTLNVYYEDEDFICYSYEQNPDMPYELAIQELFKLDKE